MREKILEALKEMGEGETLKACVRRRGLGYTTAWEFIHRDAELVELYARAREAYAHAKVQQIHEIAESEPDVQRARLKCDNIKWEASKVIPKVYGDKQEIEHTGTITIAEALQEARERAKTKS